MKFLREIITPPVFDDEVKTQQAYLLHIILWTLVCVPILITGFTYFLAREDFARRAIQGIAGEAINIFLLFMTRRGHIRTASIIQVSTFWLFFTITAITEDGVQGESYLLGYGLVIVIAGILLGGKGATIFTFLSLLAGAWMVFGHVDNANYANSPLITWIISLVLFPVGAILQRLASHTLQTALARARATEEKYRLISQVSTDYVFASEVHGDGTASLSWVAGAFKQMTGYTYEEYVAKGGWLAHIHPDDREKDAQDMEMLYKNQDVKSEIRTFTKSGEIRWERIFAHPVWDEKENRLVGIVGAVQDVTSSKQAEEKLTETLLQQSAILNGIPDMVWLKDINSRYIAVNEQFAATSGRQIQEIVGKDDFDIWQKEYAKKYREDDLEILQSGSRREIEELQADSSGREYWVETIKTPILNAQGEAVGTIGLAREITERKRAELEREKLITELETKNAELERFTYTVSHDLKSPLVTITGFLGYLEQDAQAGSLDKLKHDIRRIETAVAKMQNLLKDLLELSRIGRVTNPPEEVSFQEIVNDALEIMHGQIQSKNAAVEFRGGNIKMKCDRIRITEVMQNLIDNAIKFMGDQPDPKIEIGSITANNETIFYVKDNGAGIAPKFHEQIFGLFNKLNADSEGTGVGLALVKRIIEVNKGRIWVESQSGSGATFYFTLPQSN